ncbi:MAG TPA: DUF3330 domain-containing protein [Thiobacillus sp.]|nr:MAG: hypothetical protein B7Y50_09675 [Hydrogenophilales bacterium 28-61-11]OYZ57183.1 MAG: hypothetical protein B7Y21_08555 [Hydrogenophilales bacterium 16-61-112]OZA43142.1 MAG: hypothetical protein B7X81_11695 [Hydrogenophilales bacterium 17-61-76]HQT31413.1 DUF3330 domain-containing protein [Thiobacillus sp.]HQT70802.1 DUF3330 domain-containing protein [Thiobacillus sp.]
MDTRNRSPAGGLLMQCADEEACTVLSCEVCLKELPADSVKLSDVQDYVHHFCGLECLAAWQKQAALANKAV